ncbi:MAG: hypothetical protein K0B11_12370 [Mariniphaga sp.]|nr:hypothetical protein [Mariniphaga sp.]
MAINQYIPTIVFQPSVTLGEKLQEMDIGIKEFAFQTELPEKIIKVILAGTSAITPELAIKFEKATKIPADFWMRKQQRYDEFKTRDKTKSIVIEAPDWKKDN